MEGFGREAAEVLHSTMKANKSVLYSSDPHKEQKYKEEPRQTKKVSATELLAKAGA